MSCCLVFQTISDSWFDLYKRHKGNINAAESIKTIDNVTNYALAYSKLFLSLYLINEDKTGKYKDDLNKIVSGYFLLCETIDVFVELFSIEELEQINYGVENAVFVSNRSIADYFEEDLEISNLITQLRAYSSLILLKIEEYNNRINYKRDEHSDWENQLKFMAEDIEIQHCLGL